MVKTADPILKQDALSLSKQGHSKKKIVETLRISRLTLDKILNSAPTDMETDNNAQEHLFDGVLNLKLS
ncbi:MAG: hypothetical protein QXU18_08105 [Thermoplasmatales archaeon]